MRVFLIIISFINTLFYVLFYAYYDNVLSILGISLGSAVFQNFIKLLFLLIIGFCIGIMVMLLLPLKLNKSYFDIKNLIILGIVPFLLIVFSLEPVTNFIIYRFFSDNESFQELIFYLFSRQILWSVWLGFAIGTSIRFSFKKRQHRHSKTYKLTGDNILESKK